MSIPYDILLAPDPVLKQQAHPVSNVGAEEKDQVTRMIETMYAAPGIGLAANQVGLLNRIFVLDVPECGWHYAGEDDDGVLRIETGYKSGEGDPSAEPQTTDQNPIAMINPEIIWSSDQHSVFEEGCLSLPKQYADIVRPAHVKVKFLDANGQQNEMDASGLLSHCIQHELDHLNGVLFVDYISRMKRNMMIRKVQKIKKQQEVL